MSHKQKVYDAEVGLEAVRLLKTSSKSGVQIAQELNISGDNLYT